MTRSQEPFQKVAASWGEEVRQSPGSSGVSGTVEGCSSLSSYAQGQLSPVNAMGSACSLPRVQSTRRQEQSPLCGNLALQLSAQRYPEKLLIQVGTCSSSPLWEEHSDTCWGNLCFSSLCSFLQVGSTLGAVICGQNEPLCGARRLRAQQKLARLPSTMISSMQDFPGHGFRLLRAVDWRLHWNQPLCFHPPRFLSI